MRVDPRFQSFVEEVDYRPHRRLAAHAFVGHQPQVSPLICARRGAADEVGLAVRDEARQNADTEARADTGEQAGHRRLADRNLLIDSEMAEKGLIDPPGLLPAAADQRVSKQFLAVAGDAMAIGVIAAAIKGPGVETQPPSDDAVGRWALDAAQSDVGLARAEVAQLVGFVEFEPDLGMEIVELGEPRREDGVGKNVAGRQADIAAGLAGDRGRGILEAIARRADLEGVAEQGFAGRRQHIARLAPVEEGQADGFLERGDAAGDGRLADAQAARGGEGAAGFGYRREVSEVAPIDHARIHVPESRWPHSAIMQNDNANSLLLETDFGDYLDSRTQSEKECDMKILASLLLPIALLSAPVSADPIQAESLTVSIADLDLSSTTGQRTFDRRLGRAVVELCGQAADVDLAGRNAVRKCRADTLAQAYQAKDQRVALRSADPIQIAARD